MANEPLITVVGNLTADPELRYTQGGLGVVNFTIAQTPREKIQGTDDWKDGEPIYFRSSCWREFAENCAQSLVKGTRVIALGRLKNRSYDTKEGEHRTALELEIESIGPDLRYATATVLRSGGGSATQSRNAERQRAGTEAQRRDQYADDNTPRAQAPAQQPTQQAPAQPREGYVAPGGYDDEVPF